MSTFNKLVNFKNIFFKSNGLRDFAFPEMPTQLTLLDFKVRETFDKVFTTSDASLDGFSTVHLDPVYEGQGVDKKLLAHFHGNLNLNLPERNKKVKDSGWAMWKTRDKIKDGQFKLFYPTQGFANFWWDWNPYQALALRVRTPTPHRKFYVNVQLDTMSRIDLYQHRLFLEPGNTNWQLVFIPLEDFVLTNKGKIVKQYEGEMMKHRVKSIGLSISDKQYGEFQLFIDSIECVGDRTYLERMEEARDETWNKQITEKKDTQEVI